MSPLEARKKRGWTRYEAKRRSGISDGSLARLEADPSADALANTSVATVVKLVQLYEGDVNLDDFLPGCGLELTPRWGATG